ncbi:MAG: glutaredoxin [Raoultibacter sp.]
MSELVLYKKDACPYCQKVFRFIEANSSEVTLRDIVKDPEARAELLRVGGKAQVPCLFIDGKPLYESSDIIAYLGK